MCPTCHAAEYIVFQGRLRGVSKHNHPLALNRDLDQPNGIGSYVIMPRTASTDARASIVFKQN